MKNNIQELVLPQKQPIILFYFFILNITGEKPSKVDKFNVQMQPYKPHDEKLENFKFFRHSVLYEKQHRLQYRHNIYIYITYSKY